MDEDSSNKKNGYSYNFDDRITIIHGANTSGKSTLMQTILYMFGINDMNKFLDSIYANKYFLRLDALIKDETEESPLVVIRNEDKIYVKIGESPIKEFVGISSNSSYEHQQARDFFKNLFKYDLKLFQKDVLKDASLETMFLPYYISQSVGWVSIRKTFDGLEYYKNFKESFIDYCLGVVNTNDLSHKYILEEKLSELKSQMTFVNKYLEENIGSVICNEEFVSDFNEYVDEVSNNEKKLVDLNKKLLLEKNKLSLLRSRLNVVRTVKNNLISQEKAGYVCPVCHGKLSDTLSDFYIRKQNLNDCELEIKEIESEIKGIMSSLNSINVNRNSLTDAISKNRKCLDETMVNGISVEDWLDGVTKFRIRQKVENDKINCQRQIEHCQKQLKSFKTDGTLVKERSKFDAEFKKLFIRNLLELGFENDSLPQEARFFDLYKISALPYQGTELLKAHLAYHFAFNEIITINKNMPRLPFLLDAIFKEDIDEHNKRLILSFIANHIPADTQLIFSVADKLESNQLTAKDAKEEYFNDANLILVSDNQRSLLNNYTNEVETIKQDTLEMLFQS